MVYIEVCGEILVGLVGAILAWFSAYLDYVGQWTVMVELNVIREIPLILFDTGKGPFTHSLS